MNQGSKSILRDWIIVTLLFVIPSVVGDRGFHSVGGIPIAAIFGIFVAIAILVLCCRFLCRPAGQGGRTFREFEAPVTIVTQTGPIPTSANPTPTPFQPLMYPNQPRYSPVTTTTSTPYPTTSPYAAPYPPPTSTTPYPLSTASQMSYSPYPPTETTIPALTRPQYPYPVYPPTATITTTSYPATDSAPPSALMPTAPSAPLVDYGNIPPPAYSTLYPERVNTTNDSTSGH